jgi:hypothetical protein
MLLLKYSHSIIFEDEGHECHISLTTTIYCIVRYIWFDDDKSAQVLPKYNGIVSGAAKKFQGCG